MSGHRAARTHAPSVTNTARVSQDGVLGRALPQSRHQDAQQANQRATRYGSAPRSVLRDFSQIPAMTRDQDRGLALRRLTLFPSSAGLQRKLRVGQVDEPLDHETDQVAAQVMDISSVGAVSEASSSGPTGRDREPMPGVLTSDVAGNSSAKVAREPPSGVHEALLPSGQPLDAATRSFFEPRFGHDFSRVRVHADELAAESTRAVQARAYTVGHNIVFGAGLFAPQSEEGRRLLAHELAHVVQVDAAAAQPALPSTSVKTLELEARQVGNAVQRGHTISPIRGVARNIAGPLCDEPEDPGKPTYGNLPRDQADERGMRARVQLVEENGVWYELGKQRGHKYRASGQYSFVIQDGKIWGVNPTGRMDVRRGHTEAAGGRRVEYAGTVWFGTNKAERGKLLKWSNQTGHYAPVSNERFREVAIAAGLPRDTEDKKLFQKEVGGRPPAGGPQLPVFQPKPGDVLTPRGQERPAKQPGSQSTPAGGEPAAPASPAPPTSASGKTPSEDIGHGPTAPIGSPGKSSSGGGEHDVPTKTLPSAGRRFLFHLSHTAILMLLDYISSWLMAKIEGDLFEQDCKKLEPAIQTAVSQQQGKIDGLLKLRKTIYANVRLEIVRNWVSNADWQSPGGDYRYFTTTLRSVDISTENISAQEEPRLETVAGQLWMYSPFTYSFPLGKPVMVSDMPAGFQSVLDHVAIVLQDIQRAYSIGGPRFAALNESVDMALRVLGASGVWDPAWAETLAMSDAQRLTAVRSAVDRAERSARNVFGANPGPDEDQVLVQLALVKLHLNALNDNWPLTLEEGLWRSSSP